MFRKKNYLALGAVTLLALLILSLPPRVTAHLKLAVGSYFHHAAARLHRDCFCAKLLLDERHLLLQLLEAFKHI